jgi:hypothetical protein
MGKEKPQVRFNNWFTKMCQPAETKISKILSSKFMLSLRKVTTIIWHVLWVIFKYIAFVYDSLYEPLFLGFTLYVVFNRLQNIVNYFNAHPHSKWWEVFSNEMNTNPILYTLFFILLVGWVLLKAIHTLREKQRDDAILKELKDIKKLIKGDSGNGESKQSDKPKS